MESMYGKDPQAELADIPQIFTGIVVENEGEAPNFQQYSYKVIGILANSAWGSFPYMHSKPSEGP